MSTKTRFKQIYWYIQLYSLKSSNKNIKTKELKACNIHHQCRKMINIIKNSMLTTDNSK